MYSVKLTWDTQEIYPEGQGLLFLMESSAEMVILELEGTLEVIALSLVLSRVRKLRPVIDVSRHTADCELLGKPLNRCGE